MQEKPTVETTSGTVTGTEVAVEELQMGTSSTDQATPRTGDEITTVEDRQNKKYNLRSSTTKPKILRDYITDYGKIIVCNFCNCLCKGKII